MAKIQEFNIAKLRTEEDFSFQKRIEAKTALLTVETDKQMVAAYKAAYATFIEHINVLIGQANAMLSARETLAEKKRNGE